MDPRALARSARRGISPAAVTRKRKYIALALASVADLIQAGFFPVFSEGALSVFNDGLDLIVIAALLFTLGFRWRLVFALALEMIPAVDLFPSWSAVVLSLPVLPEPDPALPVEGEFRGPGV